MLITKQSQLTGTIVTRDLPITQEQLDAFNAGKLVQHVFPELSAADREWLCTGITAEEWKEAFGE